MMKLRMKPSLLFSGMPRTRFTAVLSLLLFPTQIASFSATTTSIDVASKPTWKVFVDLQCPFARKTMTRLPEIRNEFGDQYDISVHLTSLAFHAQAFPGQQAAFLIGLEKGEEPKKKFIEHCFMNQDRYTNDALGDCRKSDVDKVFAGIAGEIGIFDGDFTKTYFLENLHDFTRIVKPTYAEHKIALGYGVFGTPKHVIRERLVADTESTWGVEEWRSQLEKLSASHEIP